MSQILATLVMITCLASASPSVRADAPMVLTLWPDKPPGETTTIGEEKYQDARPGEKPVKRLTNVSKPTLTLFRPAKEKDTGAAVIIAPGGAYSILAWDLEGEEVAQWLNSIGVTGIILKYRVPRRPDQPRDTPPIGPQQDAQRAVSLLRSKAKDWGIDPNRIGMLGFSAGGHLTAATATGFSKRTYEPLDDIDRVSCRPDFVVLIYPAYLVTKDNSELDPSIRVSREDPPMFFAHAADDGVKAENSIRMVLALRRVGVPAELHLYTKGGHGFGLRPSEHACCTWPQRCEEWLKAQGMLKAR